MKAIAVEVELLEVGEGGNGKGDVAAQEIGGEREAAEAGEVGEGGGMPPERREAIEVAGVGQSWSRDAAG